MNSHELFVHSSFIFSTKKINFNQSCRVVSSCQPPTHKRDRSRSWSSSMALWRTMLKARTFLKTQWQNLHRTPLCFCFSCNVCLNLWVCLGIHPTVRLQKNAAGNCRNYGSQRSHNAVKNCTQRVPTSWWYTQAQAWFINYKNNFESTMFLVLFSNNSRNNSMAITFARAQSFRRWLQEEIVHPSWWREKQEQNVLKICGPFTMHEHDFVRKWRHLFFFDLLIA